VKYTHQERDIGVSDSFVYRVASRYPCLTQETQEAVCRAFEIVDDVAEIGDSWGDISRASPLLTGAVATLDYQHRCPPTENHAAEAR
jgi:hypothetical protein